MRPSAPAAIAIAVVGTTLALIAAAGAAPPAAATIEQCAALLPAGKQYSFEIKGTIDTTGESPALSGEISVADGTQQEASADSQAFAECIAALIR
jgi:hypothetical protein